MIRLAITLSSAWEQVREIRARVCAALVDAPEELRDAATMVASELAENAIKHGDHRPGVPPAQFELTATDDELVITVTSAIHSAAQAAALREWLARITACDDKEALYLERLRELMNDPAASDRLGLYRIAYEGGFELQLRCDGRTARLTARRARR